MRECKIILLLIVSDWCSPIIVCNASCINHVNEFVSIPELMQSRKDKINSKDISERFLFSLFDTLVMSQIVK